MPAPAMVPGQVPAANISSMALFWWNERRRVTWEQSRAQMIAETSTFISEALKHPELAVRIPVVEAGRVEFPPSMSRAFWGPLLEDGPLD